MNTIPRRALVRWCVTGVLALACLPSSTGFAQSTQFETVPLGPPQIFDTLGVEDGLITGQIADIAQDSEGFLWLGTLRGLVRYDGNELVTYQPEEGSKTAILSANVTALVTDSAGTLYVGTDLGLQRRRPGDVFEQVALEKTETANITTLFREGDNVWVGTQAGGVFSLEKGASQARAIATVDDAVLAFVKAGDAMYIGAGTGIFELRGSTIKKVFERPSVRALAVVGGKVYAGAEDGMYTGADFESLRRSDITETVTSMLVDGKSLWVGTRHDLFDLDVETGRSLRYKQNRDNSSSLQSSDITCSFKDEAGVLWFGTLSAGVAKYDPLRSQFAPYPLSRHAGGLQETPDGRIWIGTFPGSVTIVDRKERKTTVFTKVGNEATSVIDLSPYWIPSLHLTPGGELWLGTNGGGLVRVNVHTNDAYHYGEDEIGATIVLAIAPAGGEDVLVATGENGLLRFDSASNTFVSIARDQLSSPGIYSITRDRKDQDWVWLGTAGGFDHVNVQTGEVQAHPYDQADKDGLSGQVVDSIYQADDGILWLGTFSDGLDRFDPKTGKFKVYRTKDGLAEDAVLGIAPDGKGRLWLMSNSGGLTRFDPKDGSTLIFTSKDGVIPEFSQSSYFSGVNGEVLVGGVAGFNVFKPAEMSQDSFAPPLVLTSFTVGGEPVPLIDGKPAHPIEMGYREASIAARFAALTFAAPKGTTYRYRVKGQHDDWITTRQPSLQYAKLDPGDYTLEVEAVNRHGVEAASTITIPMTVTPPWWRSWYAYLAYALLIAAGVFGYLRYQRQRFAQLETENRLAHVERDIELTAAVQNGFLPEVSDLQIGDVKICGFYRAAEACSGDWWFYEQPSEDRLIVIVGDVTGHGPGPAMVTAAVGTAFRVTMGGSLRERLEVLNQEVLAVGQNAYHMTVTALDLDLRTGKGTVLGLGGLPMLYLADSPRSKVVHAPGTPLGTRELVVGTKYIDLKPGERVLICTDGIPEIEEAGTGRQLGMRQLGKVFADTRGSEITAASKVVLANAEKIQGAAPQADDWTFVIVERDASLADRMPPPERAGDDDAMELIDT